MDFVKQNKILKIFLLVLVILNLGILGFLIWSQGHKKPPVSSNDPMQFLIQKVGFDEKQATSYRELVQEHRKTAGELRRKINDKREELFDYNTRTGDKKRLLDEITLLKREDEQLLYDHFARVRQLCNTNEQRQSFDSVIHKMLRKMQGPHPQGSPSHRPPPH